MIQWLHVQLLTTRQAQAPRSIATSPLLTPSPPNSRVRCPPPSTPNQVRWPHPGCPAQNTKPSAGAVTVWLCESLEFGSQFFLFFLETGTRTNDWLQMSNAPLRTSPRAVPASPLVASPSTVVVATPCPSPAEPSVRTRTLVRWPATLVPYHDSANTPRPARRWCPAPPLGERVRRHSLALGLQRPGLLPEPAQLRSPPQRCRPDGTGKASHGGPA